MFHQLLIIICFYVDYLVLANVLNTVFVPTSTWVWVFGDHLPCKQMKNYYYTLNCIFHNIRLFIIIE